MKLNLIERILINNLLPRQDCYFTTLIVVQDIDKKVIVNQQELVDFEIKTDENGDLKWNKKGDEYEVDIDFTDLEKTIIKEQLEDLNKRKKLNLNYIRIFKYFECEEII